MRNKSDKPRLIATGSVILKCVDGHWSDGDGLTPATEMLAVATTIGLQCWSDKELLDEIVERPGEKLPNVDDLNKQIPRNEWRPGLDGQPRPPWQLNWVIYLIDLESATKYTFLNSTTGAKIAVTRLADKMKTMRILRGAGVRPLVKLDSRPMKTSYGQKMRPEFTVIDWRDFGEASGGLLPGGGTPTLEYHGKNKGLEARQDAQANNLSHKKELNARKKPGKPVKPVSVSEEIDDGLPGDLAPPADNIMGAG
jgi:hypothetical protein